MGKNESENIIAIIEDRLIGYEYHEIAKKIETAERTGSTGGEVITDIASILLDIKAENPRLYNLLDKEIKTFLDKYRKFLF
jgi:hypothetical protein